MNGGVRAPGHRTTTALRTCITRLTAFIGLVAASFVGQEPPRPVEAAVGPRFKAVAFDYLFSSIQIPLCPPWSRRSLERDGS